MAVEWMNKLNSVGDKKQTNAYHQTNTNNQSDPWIALVQYHN
jgi:hypothetical protein